MPPDPVPGRHTVGIDLGTSNTVVAFAAPGEEEIEVFAIEQLVGLGQVAARPLLPSVRFHPAPGELDPRDLRLPWSPNEDAVVIGRLALDLGSQVPGRLVSSAKSWLSHAAVDRTAAVLPWGAESGIPRISPVAASASYLAHVRAAWNDRFPNAPLEEQEVILTVPASFDEGARALTLQAAHAAGLSRLRLLEEPQAAFYDWLYRHQRDAAECLATSRLLLVCDVGGGTTDLTLIQVKLRGDEPELTRIGVGDHLMLGGDNMDLALAHLVEGRLPASEGRLSAGRFAQLGARCRAAKEQLLAADAPEAVSLTLLGTGSRLIGGARSVDLKRDEVGQIIGDGFFPQVPIDERLQQRRAAIVEFGLPYPADPAITRQLAAFLRRHAEAACEALATNEAGNSEPPLPDTLLLNGGVFRAQKLADRIQETLSSWRGSSLRLLDNDDPEVAVARGAVASALLRRNRGRRIGGGSARSYFLVLDDAATRPRGICILPRGTEEGHEIRLTAQTFSLRLNQPVRFHLASSIADTRHHAGDLCELTPDDFIRLPPIATIVPPQASSTQREVRVQLLTTMTEIGTLELHCVSVEEPAQRWLLEFQLRGEASETGISPAVLPPHFAPAVQVIEQVFGVRSQNIDPREVRRLRGQLEHLLGKREDWDLPLLRALFDALLQRSRRRRRSAEHERLWLNLAGYCLRPGLGEALDDWRIEQLSPLLTQGIEYVNESQNWSEWWTFWRRVAGGLPGACQQNLFAALTPALRNEAARPRSRVAQAMAGSQDDQWRLVASLERVRVEDKIELGESLCERLGKMADKSLSCWALGRIGARESLYGSAHQIVPPVIAERWLAALLALDWKRIEPAAFAATQIARLTGDRSRDITETMRDEVLARLSACNACASWTAQVKSLVELDRADQRRAFGESLPAGLRLIANQTAASEDVPATRRSR